MSFTWRLIKDGSESLTARSKQWDDVYVVTGYVQGGEPAWTALIADRPSLAPGSAYGPAIPFAYVDTFTPDRLDDTESWIVKVHYKLEGQDNQLDQSPLERPARITLDSETIEVPTFRKANGDWWLTAAGELLYGVTREENRYTFNVEKNVATYPAYLLSLKNAVNSDSLTIKGLSVAAGYLKFKLPSIPDVEAEDVNGIRVEYYPLRFQLEYNPNTWEKKELHRGLYRKNADGKIVPCIDSNREPATEPCFLDTDGTQLGVSGAVGSETVVAITPGDINTIDGWNHDQTAFDGVLPLT